MFCDTYGRYLPYLVPLLLLKYLFSMFSSNFLSLSSLSASVRNLHNVVEQIEIGRSKDDSSSPLLINLFHTTRTVSEHSLVHKKFNLVKLYTNNCKNRNKRHPI